MVVLNYQLHALRTGMLVYDRAYQFRAVCSADLSDIPHSLMGIVAPFSAVVLVHYD